MARGINKVILIGTLGDEPVFNTGRSGRVCASLRLLTRTAWLSPQSGSSETLTEWHRVILPEALTDLAREYLHKGTEVYVEGRLHTRSYTDKQGIKKSVTEIIAGDALVPGIRTPAPPRPERRPAAARSPAEPSDQAASSSGAAGAAGAARLPGNKGEIPF